MAISSREIYLRAEAARTRGVKRALALSCELLEVTPSKKPHLKRKYNDENEEEGNKEEHNSREPIANSLNETSEDEEMIDEFMAMKLEGPERPDDMKHQEKFEMVCGVPLMYGNDRHWDKKTKRLSLGFRGDGK